MLNSSNNTSPVKKATVVDKAGSAAKEMFINDPDDDLESDDDSIKSKEAEPAGPSIVK